MLGERLIVSPNEAGSSLPKMVLHVTINGSSLLSGDERDLMGWEFTESVFCLLE